MSSANDHQAPPDFAATLAVLAQQAGLQWLADQPSSEPVWRRAAMTARLLPNPGDGQRALLSVTVRPLEAELSSGNAAGLSRALRWLFRIDADLMAPQGWTLGIDDEGQLVLGTDLHLSECTPQTLPPRVDQGFELGQTLSETWDALAAADAQPRLA